ncbi:SDR family oxidoreductase [Sinomonas sp. ASV486]|uniref:SDR family oxidoreductase n=1 Tax=Sinomonas sp. ASV486 TaxID=3051170 RepID=UPI0027DD3404|nr:SDR family oxidoreductase [Sinomonas sp. ASV486]MDQ4489789.1 SDR family oxidoreductase [Sinomonas sp. ASV486]
MPPATETRDATGAALFDLTGRTALVTGSSRGIGYALASGLARAGATVILNGQDTDRLEDARARLEEEVGPDRVVSSAFDVTDEMQVSGAIDHLERSLGPIDILVNNAGIQHRVALFDLARKDWDRVLSTNLTSAFLVGREAARNMASRGRGKIINVCSIQSELARPTIGAYTASKGGLRNLTRAMTAEWASSGIQANGIAPGYISTEMTRALTEDEKFNSWVLGRTPAARWGSPQDLVGPTVWLASSASDFVNGQTIFVDGGMSVVV